MKESICALRVFIVLSLLTGVIYPFVITGMSRVEFRQQSRGNMITLQGRVVGSSLIGQQFTSAKYFHGRPSAQENAYDARNSGGSNWGPSNDKFLQAVGNRVRKVREDDGLGPLTSVPADTVLASGSGLDPHISAAAAILQIGRVAEARGFPEAVVKDLVQSHVETPLLGFLGQSYINVLRLNLALDELYRPRTRFGGFEPDKRG